MHITIETSDNNNNNNSNNKPLKVVVWRISIIQEAIIASTCTQCALGRSAGGPSHSDDKGPYHAFIDIYTSAIINKLPGVP